MGWTWQTHSRITHWTSVVLVVVWPMQERCPCQAERFVWSVRHWPSHMLHGGGWPGAALAGSPCLRLVNKRCNNWSNTKEQRMLQVLKSQKYSTNARVLPGWGPTCTCIVAWPYGSSCRRWQKSSLRSLGAILAQFIRINFSRSSSRFIYVATDDLYIYIYIYIYILFCYSAPGCILYRECTHPCCN
jgi:hypothetical protein